jgi:hypothetical protein
VYQPDGESLAYNTKESLLNQNFSRSAMRPTPGESGSQPFLRDRINTRYRAICGSKKVGWKTGQKSDQRRTAKED